MMEILHGDSYQRACLAVKRSTDTRQLYSRWQHYSRIVPVVFWRARKQIKVAKGAYLSWGKCCHLILRKRLIYSGPEDPGFESSRTHSHVRSSCSREKCDKESICVRSSQNPKSRNFKMSWSISIVYLLVTLHAPIVCHNLAQSDKNTTFM